VCRRALVAGVCLAAVAGPVSSAVGREVPVSQRDGDLTSGLGSGSATPEEPPLRLLSSPDFLNADVADLRRGPGFWSPQRSENGINESYRRALERILDDWVAQEPDAVLVAGDLVDGRWGRDERHVGTFGPVRTLKQQKAALRRAAATYYPQWLERFAEHGLEVFPAIGDHEYGDNDWPRGKRALAPVFADAFADHFTRTGSGAPRFADHPSGPHAGTAYAWRPRADVQVVSIDVFDITRGDSHLRVDRAQLTWLRSVLQRAQRDGVTWTVVQGHTPILGPTRHRGSSQLGYEGGSKSELWDVFREYGVDVYLCGEVHAITATTRDGILQLAHGGAFQFGLTSYAVLDFHPDRLEVSVNDYKLRLKDAEDGSRLWETVRDGMRKIALLGRLPSTVGTLVLGTDGQVHGRTGLLRPFKG
jgi:Calcineurin-like phosphoesterase